MSAHTYRRLAALALGTTIVAGCTFGLQATSSAHARGAVTAADCRGNPWTKASYQASSTPELLGAQVLACLKLDFPKTYLHDEVGIVALVHDGRFQNINEFGLTSTVQKQLAQLGVPPITLEDGPGGLLVGSNPKPTQLPNELALGATFDSSLATEYGQVLGSQAHQMGFDGVQAPDLNLVRVPTWGRSMESFGESPVLAGYMGAAVSTAIAQQGEIPVLKHFGPYSQETDRHQVDQLVSPRAYQEVYIRPFTMALEALIPTLQSGHHAVGVMCSYGNVNATRACRSPQLARLLNGLHINALVRSDLDVWVPPTALLQNAIDLIKPMDSVELTHALDRPAVDKSLDKAVTQIFTTEFAAGLVHGGPTLPVFHPLSSTAVTTGGLISTQIEEHAAVLLKDDGLLPLHHGDGPVAVVADPRVRGTCRNLASALAHDLGSPAECVDPAVPLPRAKLFHHLSYARRQASAIATFTPKATGTYVAAVTTWATTKLSLGRKVVLSTTGYSAFGVQRTAVLMLHQGVHYKFRIQYKGIGPVTSMIDEQPMLLSAENAVRGARAAVVVGYDLSREGMDRNTLALPNAQDAMISAIATRVPTAVMLATDGAVTMPWLPSVHAVLEVWNPTGVVWTDATLNKFVFADANLLTGASDPSGHLPITFPLNPNKSPMAVHAFWPGNGVKVNLDAAPYGGLGIGQAWYRKAGWPVLFPFGYGLSYTSYQLLGGTVTDPSTGLQVNVAVRDTGGVAGTEVVQVYANLPSSVSEPPKQLVGYATVTFSAHDAATRAIQHVSIPITPDVLAVDLKSGLAVVNGQYCLEAATYDGDPHAWTTGSIPLGPGPGATITGPATRLNQGSCPS
jgi:beta-glucosidase